jgi:hypothetical protein
MLLISLIVRDPVLKVSVQYRSINAILFRNFDIKCVFHCRRSMPLKPPQKSIDIEGPAGMMLFVMSVTPALLSTATLFYFYFRSVKIKPTLPVPFHHNFGRARAQNACQVCTFGLRLFFSQSSLLLNHRGFSFASESVEMT